MICKYINSVGKTMQFLGDTSINNSNIRISSGTVHKRAWKPSITSNRVGGKVDYFESDPQEIPLTITVRGSASERKALLNDLFDLFETDIVNNQPGTLYYGAWYCQCFVTSSESKAGDIPTWISQDVTIYIPSAMWYSDQTYSITKISGESSDVVYPTTYSFTYPISQPTTVSIANDHFTDCDFQLKAYGPFTGLSVEINGNDYTVNHEVESDQILVIDSRDTQDAEKRIYILNSDGTTENVYNDRDSDCEIFQKIPSGNVTVTYTRSYGIDLTIFKGRREPKWQV